MASQTPAESSGSKLDYYLKVVIGFLCVLAVPMLYLSVQANNYLNSHSNDYEVPQISELWKGLACGIVITPIMILIDYLSYPFFYKINKVKDNEELRIAKSKKQTSYLFKSLFYLCIVPYEIYYFRNEHWWPKFLGGACPFNEMAECLFKDHPYQDHWRVPYIKEFYMV